MNIVKDDEEDEEQDENNINLSKTKTIQNYKDTFGPVVQDKPNNTTYIGFKGKIDTVNEFVLKNN